MFKIAIVGSRKVDKYNLVEKEFFKLINELKLIKENILLAYGDAKELLNIYWRSG